MDSVHFRNFALLAQRLVIAAIFLFAGIMKLGLWSGPMEGMSTFMWRLMQFFSIAEPIGAIALILGFLVRPAATCLAIIMVGAIWISTFTYGMAFFTMPQAPGTDTNALILAGCIILMAFGAGDWAVDKLWKRKAVVTVAA